MTFSLGSTPRSLVKYNDQSVSAITEVGSGAGVQDAMVLIKTITASSSDTATFDSDIDSTYPTYLFKYIGIHPANSNPEFTVNFRDGSTAYDATKTTTYFNTHHIETGTEAGLAYNTDMDLTQATTVQNIIQDLGNDNDQAGSGELWLFNPSSTTFVKHFMGRSANIHGSDYAQDIFYAGYCNTTSAIDGVQFKFSAGNIDAGTIKMYGIKDS